MRYQSIFGRLFLAVPVAAMLAIAVGSAAAQEEAQVEQDQQDQRGRQQTAARLVSPERLAENLRQPQLRIVDVRSAADYQKSHIPGAVHVDVGEWRDKALSPMGLHDKEYWSEEVRKRGISRDNPVVVYAVSPTDAARAWWTLTYVGLPRVAILDGGWEQWTAANHPTASAMPVLGATNFEAEFQSDRVAEVEALKQALAADEKKVTVLDARSESEYSDGGHLPGAVNLEWSELLDEQGRYKSPEALRELFIGRGLNPESTVVTHCQSGGRSSVEMFALELAGFENVQNYYCGWSEWGRDPQAPVEK